jgi:hypothetical protein
MGTIAVGLLVAALASPAAARLPCTSIPVVLVDTLDSGTARTGDTFRFRTIDTIVAGKVTIPGNAIGYGIVSYASPAGAHGKGGDLLVEARYIDLGPRGQYQVMIDSVATTANKAGASGNVSAGVGSIIPYVGTAVGAFNYLHAGKNAVIRAGFRFVVVPVAGLARGLRCAL